MRSLAGFCRDPVISQLWARTQRVALLVAASVLGIGPAQAQLRSPSQLIESAHYLQPTERYGHFALGRPHEYAALSAVSATGTRWTLQLPENEVFEDATPRLVQLGPDEPVELLTIVSQRGQGARLVLVGLGPEGLFISAQSAPIGRNMRWLNPVAVADLNGDGRAEISAVITPHLDGVLKAYRRQGQELIEVAALSGFSNHHYGSPVLDLARAVSLGGRTLLAVPDRSHTQLRLMALQAHQWKLLGQCKLPARVVGAITAQDASVSAPNARWHIELSTGPHPLKLADCIP